MRRGRFRVSAVKINDELEIVVLANPEHFFSSENLGMNIVHRSSNRSSESRCRVWLCVYGTLLGFTFSKRFKIRPVSARQFRHISTNVR